MFSYAGGQQLLIVQYGVLRGVASGKHPNNQRKRGVAQRIRGVVNANISHSKFQVVYIPVPH